MHPRSRLPALLSGVQVNQLIMQSMSYSNSVDADASLLHLLHMLEHYFYLSQTVSDPYSEFAWPCIGRRVSHGRLMFCPHHPLCPEAPVLPEAGGTRSSWFCPGQHGRRPGLHEPANLTDHDTGVVVYLSSQNLTDHWRRRVLIEPIPTQIIALCASSERGGLGERKREIDRRARQQASAHSSPDSHPEGQYRTTLHRGPAPCVFLRLDALAADSPRRRRQ